MNTQEKSIAWPPRFHPDVAPVHVSNSLEMRASPELVWRALVDAWRWPEWYPNARNVRILSGGDFLAPGATFRWTTFGATIVSEVVEFLPFERIAWTGRAIGIDVYHAWLIAPSQTGCRVRTEETQYGFLARLASRLMPQRMRTFHQIWLENLERRAASARRIAP